MQNLDADAFRNIYTDQFYERFLEKDVRPDGRPLGRSRPTSVGVGAVSSCASSCLVKVGSTAVMCGVKLEVMQPVAAQPDKGQVQVSVELPPLCSAAVRPGRPCQEAESVAERVQQVVTRAVLTDLTQLCIVKGQAAWMVYVDLVCLCADGSVFDAALLAGVVGLSGLVLPEVVVSSEGLVTVDSPGAAPSAEAAGCDSSRQVVSGRAGLSLACSPVALTTGIYQGRLLADPNAEEEALLEAHVTVVMDQKGNLVSVYKPGGTVGASDEIMMECIEMARLRVKEVSKIVQNSIPTA